MAPVMVAVILRCGLNLAKSVPFSRITRTIRMGSPGVSGASTYLIGDLMTNEGFQTALLAATWWHGDECYYPRYKDPNRVAKAVKSLEVPKDNWLRYKVRVRAYYNDYEIARNRLEKVFQEESTESTPDEERGRHKRRKIPNRRYIHSTDEEADSPDFGEEDRNEKSADSSSDESSDDTFSLSCPPKLPPSLVASQSFRKEPATNQENGAGEDRTRKKTRLENDTLPRDNRGSLGPASPSSQRPANFTSLASVNKTPVGTSPQNVLTADGKRKRNAAINALSAGSSTVAQLPSGIPPPLQYMSPSSSSSLPDEGNATRGTSGSFRAPSASTSCPNRLLLGTVTDPSAESSRPLPYDQLPAGSSSAASGEHDSLLSKDASSSIRTHVINPSSGRLPLARSSASTSSVVDDYPLLQNHELQASSSIALDVNGSCASRNSSTPLHLLNSSSTRQHLVRPAANSASGGLNFPPLPNEERQGGSTTASGGNAFLSTRHPSRGPPLTTPTSTRSPPINDATADLSRQRGPTQGNGYLRTLARQNAEIIRRLNAREEQGQGNQENRREMPVTPKMLGFPLETMEDFRRFNQSLLEEHVKNLYIEVIYGYGGNDYNTAIHRAWKGILKWGLAKDMNFGGRRRRENQKVGIGKKRTALILRDVMKARFPSSTQLDFYEATYNFLRHAPARYASELRRLEAGDAGSDEEEY